MICRYCVLFLLALCSGIAVSQDAQTTAAKPESFNPRKIEFRIAERKRSDGLTETVVRGTQDRIYLHEDVVVTDRDVFSAVVEGSDTPTIDVRFTSIGTAKMKQASGKNVGRLLVMLVDGVAFIAPEIRDAIGSKAVVHGSFTRDEALKIAAVMAPPALHARMLLVRADWSRLADAKQTGNELRKAMKDASVPETLLDQLPSSAPEILFPLQMASIYTPQHFAELVNWLREKELIQKEISFAVHSTKHADANQMVMDDAGIGIGYSAFGDDYEDDGGFTYLDMAADYEGDYGGVATEFLAEVARLQQPGPFLNLPDNAADADNVNHIPRLYITRQPVFAWSLRAGVSEGAGSKLQFHRTVAVMERKRGQAPQAKEILDETRADCAIPDDHVAIMHAFPDRGERAFRDQAFRKGFLPLIVVAKRGEVIAEGLAAADGSSEVRPPDIVETITSVYGLQRKFWPSESGESGSGLSDKGVRLLGFTAGYSSPSREMEGVLKRMKSDQFPVQTIDVTKDPEAAQQYRVTQVPTMILLSDDKEISRFVGLTSEQELRKSMNTAAHRPVRKGELIADDSKEQSIRIYPLRTADARSTSQAISKLFGDKLIAEADLALNRLIIRAPDSVLEEIGQLMEALDPDTARQQFPNSPSPDANVATLKEVTEKVVADQRRAFEESEEKTQELAERLRSLPKSEKRSDSDDAREDILQNQLRDEVTRAFELRQKLHLMEIDQAEQKLRKARHSVKQQNVRKKQIIDQRIKELTSAAAGPDNVQIDIRSDGLEVTYHDAEAGKRVLSSPIHFSVPVDVRHVLTVRSEGDESQLLQATLEVRSETEAAQKYLTNNALPLEFTGEDIQQVQGGRLVSKVIYLEQESAVSAIETIVSTRLDPGIDPVTAAQNQGTVLMIVRMSKVPAKVATTVF